MAASKRNLKAAYTLIPMFLAMVAFQNCSPVDFAANKAIDGAQAAGQPEEPGQPQPAQPTPVSPKVCTDDSGVEYADGATWDISSDTDQMLPCPDAASRIQKNRTTDSMLCKDGVISKTGSKTEAINMVPECPAPMLSASAVPVPAAEGSVSNLNIMSQYVSEVKYTCKQAGASSPLKDGNVAVGAAQVPLTIKADVSCDIEAKNSVGVMVSAHVDIPVDCGNKMKDGGKCVEFSCKSIMALAPVNGLLTVPARTGAGICYSVKLMDAIANSSSKLTSTRDMTVLSRNHDAGGGNRNPYSMGAKVVDFYMEGPHQVKLSGSGMALAPILVDNYVLTGIYPKSVANPGASYFHAYGTSDASVIGTDAVNSILVNDQPVTVQAFATGGTSTIAPLDITNQVMEKQTYTLDARALDCGGAREMTEVYLLFQ
jgi:hypothetical protein